MVVLLLSMVLGQQWLWLAFLFREMKPTSKTSSQARPSALGLCGERLQGLKQFSKLLRKQNNWKSRSFFLFFCAEHDEEILAYGAKNNKLEKSV